jgi:acyl phosphate:glycerol-3-phosphate acyltransferase
MVVAAILGYLVGSIPTAQIVARRMGVDPLRQGDGNPGWWNMRSLVSERLATVVLVGDVAKGVVAALIGLALWGPWWVAWVAVFFAMIGHSFSAFAGLRGGKAILTWAGGMLVLSPIAVVLSLAAGAIVWVAFKTLPWGLRVATFAFPAIQAFFEPRAEVFVALSMMAFICSRFAASAISNRSKRRAVAAS